MASSPSLAGKWTYRSYVNNTALVNNAKAALANETSSALASPFWPGRAARVVRSYRPGNTISIPKH